MKSFQFLLMTLLMSVIFFTACADQSKEDVRNKAVEAVQVPPAPTTPAASTATPANNSGVKHYTCPNNCEGSGGDGAGNCPVCGTAYVHNQAYHNNNPAAPYRGFPQK